MMVEFLVVPDEYMSFDAILSRAILDAADIKVTKEGRDVVGWILKRPTVPCSSIVGSFVRFVGVATWVSTFIRTDGRRTDGQYDRLRDGHGKVDSAIDPDQEYIY